MRGGRVMDDMARLLAYFSPHCQDRTTLDELIGILPQWRRWTEGHDLFDRIRRKTLIAERDHDSALVAQYLFEEVCAQTLYNMSFAAAPFDPDSPYWIVPNAFALARALRVDEARVVEIVGR